MHYVSIRDVVGEPSTWNPHDSESAEPFQYIDISSIGVMEKAVVGVATVSPSDAPSRARQLVQTGDVLVSTVRPNLNAVAIIPVNLDGATASTGLAVLRPDTSKLDAQYLYYWVRSPGFVRAMAGRATGASYPAVTEGVVRDSKLPLPTLAEQRRIAAVLDKADGIRRKRRESLRLLDDLLRSAFLEMFGDPVRNEKGWEVRRIGDVIVEAQYGTSTRAHSEQRGVPVLRMNNLTASGGIDLADIKWCDIAPADTAKFTLRHGDVLFNRTNSPELVGKTAVWDRDEPFAFAGYLVRVRVDQSRVLPDFVSGYLNSAFGKRMLFDKAKPSINMSNLSASELKRLPIPAPPLEVQRRYSDVIQRAKQVSERMVWGQLVAQSLFDSLAQRAFAGEL